MKTITWSITGNGCFTFLVPLAVFLGILPNTASSEILDVNSDGTTVQSMPLTSGVEYLLEASGTCYYTLPYSNLADANWDQDPFVPNSMDWNAERGNLQIVGHFVTWLGTTDGTTFQPHTFSPSHIYRYYITGAGQPLDFYFADGGAYSDNLGYLTVAISKVPEPTSLVLIMAAGMTIPTRRYLRRRRR